MMQAAGEDPKDKKSVTESDLLAYAKSKLEQTEESFDTIFSRFDATKDTVNEIYESTIKLNKQLGGSGRYVEQLGKNFVDAANEILPFTEGVKTLEDAIAFAAERPTSRELANPGVVATATAAKSAKPQPACRKASSITGKIRSKCARAAISGTTPENRSCSLSCEATALPPTRKSSEITAAAVSSHVDSMVRIRFICRFGRNFSAEFGLFN